MKILFITGIFENEATGGARFAKLIYEKGGSDYTILTEDTKSGDRIIKVSAKPQWHQTKLWQYFRIPHYRKVLEESQEEYDVFIFNNPILAYGFKTAKPCFVFIHDEKLLKVNKTFRFDYLRKLFYRRLEKTVLESGVKIISNSQHISKRIMESYHVPENKISLLYQGISMQNKTRAHDREFSEGAIKLLFVKNDYLIGGLLDLYQALVSLQENNFKLTIIGTSTLKGNELKKVSNIEIDICGIQNNDEVVQQMYDHDLLCIPARFEPLGVAVMEGLAVGIPTITTGVGGLPEVTDHGKYVWQCNPHDPQSIAKQIVACITNPEERKSKSQKGKEYIHEKFDFQNVAQRLKEIIYH